MMAKLYRTDAGTWVGTQADWKEKQQEEGASGSGTPEPIEVPTNPKSDFIDFLNALGGQAPAPRPVQAETTVPTIIHTDGPIDLDELFEKAPINQRLRLAVAAIDAGTEYMTKLVAALRQRAL